MVSKEMLALGKNGCIIRDIFEYSQQRCAQIGQEKVFDFSLGNPSVPVPAAVDMTMRRLLEEEDPVALHAYTSAPGDMAVRQKLAANITARFGVPADPTLIYMTSGASASLAISLKAITNPGDEVILLAPFFTEYPVFVENAGAVSKIVPCRPGDFELDMEAIAAAINKKTRAILINSPNNPTGVVFSEKSIQALSEMLRKKSAEIGHSITLIADEPYRELVYEETVVPYIPKFYDDTIVCYSYSKSMSLPGERIGYIFVPSTVPEAKDVFAAICGAGRCQGYICAPSLLQKTVAECDGILPDIAAYDRNRALLYEGLKEIGYEVVRPQGAFYLFVKALEDDAVAFYERAKKYELLLVPSDDFGVTGYVRIAYCVTYEQIQRSLPAFRKLYDDYKKGE